jgi:hypothetical protein
MPLARRRCVRRLVRSTNVEEECQDSLSVMLPRMKCVCVGEPRDYDHAVQWQMECDCVAIRAQSSACVISTSSISHTSSHLFAILLATRCSSAACSVQRAPRQGVDCIAPCGGRWQIVVDCIALLWLRLGISRNRCKRPLPSAGQATADCVSTSYMVAEHGNVLNGQSCSRLVKQEKCSVSWRPNGHGA